MKGLSSFYVAFHHLDFAPIMFEEITTDTAISISMKINRYLSYPYNNCRQSDSLKYSSDNYTYEACLRECWSDEVYRECGCQIPGWSMNNTIPTCKLSMYELLSYEVPRNESFQVPHMCYDFLWDTYSPKNKDITRKCRNTCHD